MAPHNDFGHQVDTYPKSMNHDAGEDINDSSPTHPVPSMQGAFEESILEAGLSPEDDRRVGSDDDQGSTTGLDAEQRRQRLLDAKRYDSSWRARWRQRPGAAHHPLLKLIAQIVFGLHLLQQQQAKSDAEVVRILQAHVDEVDGFVQRTGEDLQLALDDMDERIRFLKLPMEHMDVFEVMLEERRFRSQLLEGNSKIARILDRTAKARDAALFDIHYSLDATRDMARYLDAVQGRWPRQNRSILEIAQAMRANEQAWRKCLMERQASANKLGGRLMQLDNLLKKMDTMAAAAARRTKNNSSSSLAGSKSTPSSPQLRSRYAQDAVAPATSPLPLTPRESSPKTREKPSPPKDNNAMASQTSAPVTSRNSPQQSSISAQPPRLPQQSSSPELPSPRFPPSFLNGRATPPSASEPPPRPKTADGRSHKARDARVHSRRDTRELAEFFQLRSHVNPLRSNPPDPPRHRKTDADSTGPSLRSTSMGTVDSSTGFPPRGQSVSHRSLPRSQSHELLRKFDSLGLNGNNSSAAVAVVAGTTKTTTGPNSTACPVKGACQNEPRSSGVSERDGVVSTGFTRRLSKRMKHIPGGPATHQPSGKPNSTTTHIISPTSSSNSTNKPPSRATTATASTAPTTPSSSSITPNGLTHFSKTSTNGNKCSWTGAGSNAGNVDYFTLKGLSRPLPPPPPPPDNVPHGAYSDDSGSVSQGSRPAAASIASTTASRRYRSLKKIFHRRDESGRILSLNGAAA